MKNFSIKTRILSTEFKCEGIETMEEAVKVFEALEEMAKKLNPPKKPRSDFKRDGGRGRSDFKRGGSGYGRSDFKRDGGRGRSDFKRSGDHDRKRPDFKKSGSSYSRTYDK